MKPRVLVVTTYYHPVLGGVETHARRLVRHLHRHGFGVQVLTKRVDARLPKRDVVDGVTVHRVAPSGERRAIAKWIAVPFVFARALRLRSTFDVIVCVDYRGVGVAAIAAGRLLRRPIIVQAGTAGVLGPPRHDSGLPREKRWVRALKYVPRVVYRRASHFVCIARHIEREARAAHIPRTRIHYLPHGVDLERFRPAQGDERDAIRRALGWPLDRIVVLFVGRLSLEKGVLDLVEAWRRLARLDAVLVFVGPDMPSHPWNAGPAARELVRAHELDERVRFEDPTEDPAPYYRAADVYVQPSHFEAFGISAIEALASGVAIVAAQVGGLRDFLHAGENALLHEPKDPASLASALEEALNSDALRAGLAAAGLETARAFDERVLLDRYAALIESTVRAA